MNAALDKTRTQVKAIGSLMLVCPFNESAYHDCIETVPDVPYISSA